MDSQSLVSINVVTYNSSKYVLETLDSIYNQTYKNIELIITDDASTDDTVRLCDNWIQEHKDRFRSFKIITSPQNTGISANCNRGIKACSGEWIKGIAGDDILLPNCITDNVNFIIDNDKEIKFLFSRRLDFGIKNEIDIIQQSRKKRDYFFYLDAKGQFWDLVLHECCIPSCTIFVHKNTFLSLGGYDEEIPFYEDFPMWVKATKRGYKMWLMDKPTVKYRVSDSSISFGRYNNSVKKKFTDSIIKSYDRYRYPFIKLIDKFLANYLFLYYRSKNNKLYLYVAYAYRLICLKFSVAISSKKLKKTSNINLDNYEL